MILLLIMQIHTYCGVGTGGSSIISSFCIRCNDVVVRLCCCCCYCWCCCCCCWWCHLPLLLLAPSVLLIIIIPHLPQLSSPQLLTFVAIFVLLLCCCIFDIIVLFCKWTWKRACCPRFWLIYPSLDHSHSQSWRSHLFLQLGTFKL